MTAAEEMESDTAMAGSQESRNLSAGAWQECLRADSEMEVEGAGPEMDALGEEHEDKFIVMKGVSSGSSSAVKTSANMRTVLTK